MQGCCSDAAPDTTASMTHLKPPNLRKAADAGSYVYCYLRSKDSSTAKAGSPYYIGVASSADRPLHKNHNAPVPTDRSLIRIMRQGLDWDRAAQWERLYIQRYGRKDNGTGILLNLTDGGEGAFGAVRTAEQRERYRLASQGRTHTLETRQKLSDARLGQLLTPEAKQKISESLKGRTQSAEWAEKRAAAHRGAKRSEQTRQRIQEKAIGRKSPSVANANSHRVWDDAARQRHSEAMKLAASRRQHLSLTTNDR